MKSICYSLLLMLLMTAFSHAEEPPTAKATQQDTNNAAIELANAFGAISAMSGKFKQTITDAEGENLQETEGKFKVLRPGYFLWHVAPPYEQLVIGTPQSLKVYDPDLEQMTVHKQSSFAGTPAALISGDVSAITQNYSVSRNDAKKVSLFTLTQQNDDSDFESLEFNFQGKNSLELSSMSFTDKLGQRTEIRFKKLTQNGSIEPSVFEFEPPEDTDIIIDD